MFKDVNIFIIQIITAFCLIFLFGRCNIAQETSLNILLSSFPDKNGKVESLCTTITTNEI